MNTMYVADSRYRPSKGDATPARLEILGASRICSNVAGIWQTVMRLLGALDRRMTANLGCRARLMLHGGGGLTGAERRKE